MDPIVTLRELERLEHMVEEAKGVLGFIRIDVDEFMMIVNKIRGSLPSEMKEAVVIREKRDEIIGAAHHEADSRVGSARNEAEQTKAAALAEAKCPVSVHHNGVLGDGNGGQRRYGRDPSQCSLCD